LRERRVGEGTGNLPENIDHGLNHLLIPSFPRDRVKGLISEGTSYRTVYTRLCSS
jgi:hypothetical protein